MSSQTSFGLSCVTDLTVLVSFITFIAWAMLQTKMMAQLFWTFLLLINTFLKEQFELICIDLREEVYFYTIHIAWKYFKTLLILHQKSLGSSKMLCNLWNFVSLTSSANIFCLKENIHFPRGHSLMLAALYHRPLGFKSGLNVTLYTLQMDQNKRPAFLQLSRSIKLLASLKRPIIPT